MYRQISSFVLLLTGCLLLTQNPIQAQELPFQDKILPVLFNPKVQSELELTKEQLGQLKKMLQEVKQSQQEYGRRLKEFTQSGATKDEINAKREEFIAELEKKKKTIQTDTLDVLLPHQTKRLKQLTIQVMMQETAKNKKQQSGLLTEQMMSFLEIDKKQAEKIKNKTVELQKKLAEEVYQLRQKYRDELLKELTAKQRKKYEEAVGNFFAR